jgi:hypothetical protein
MIFLVYKPMLDKRLKCFLKKDLKIIFKVFQEPLIEIIFQVNLEIKVHRILQDNLVIITHSLDNKNEDKYTLSRQNLEIINNYYFQKKVQS